SVLPIADAHRTFAQDLAAELEAMGLRVNVDLRNEKINRKVAESEQKKVPFALVVGSKEIEADSAAVRIHGEGDKGLMKISEIKALFTRLNVPGAS
ncbi:MAG: threonine--tRNA ligase, partial [Ignavibacteriae bacterium]